MAVRTTVRQQRRAGPQMLAQDTVPGKVARLVVVLLATLAGYSLAPADLAAGAYTAVVTVDVDSRRLNAELPFFIGAADGQTSTMVAHDGPLQLTVAGADAVADAPGRTIAYRLQVVDAGGRPQPLSLDQVSSTIIGPGYEQHVPPTGQADGWLTFAMRVPYRARVTMALLFAVAALWLLEVVPLAATAFLIPIVVILAGIADPVTSLQPFAHPIIVLFLAGFLMAEGMKRTEVDRWLALLILSRAPSRPVYLMLTMMALTAFLSMWMSNTASVAVVIPIALAVLARVPEEKGRTGFRRALILGVAYAATVGGIGSAIGTPANILAMTFLNDFTDADLSFVDWFAYGLPVVVVMVPVIWLYLLAAFGVRSGGLEGHLRHDVFAAELNALGGLKRGQRALLLVMTAVMGLWLTEQWHGIPTAVPALGGALALFFSGAIQQEDLGRVNWNALLTFGGGLAIGTTLVVTGVSDWLALRLTGLAGFPPLLVILLVAGLTLLVGAVISNTACAAMLIPVSIPLAQVLRIDPRLLVAVVAVASSTDFALVVGTPPTMMAYSTGLFGAGDIFKRGVYLDIIALLVLSLGVVWLWRLLGVATF